MEYFDRLTFLIMYGAESIRNFIVLEELIADVVIGFLIILLFMTIL